MSELVQAAVECVTHGLGFREQPIEQLELALNALRADGRADHELARACQAREPGVMATLCATLSDDDGYFFRFPEHFQRIERELVPGWLRAGLAWIRVWSAGCGTGAETYSLVACLQACLPPHVVLSVLGTDLVRERIEVARRGHYDPERVHARTPLLFPVLRREGATLVVPEGVREVADFRVHNLLEQPPQPAEFELVLCSNVLVSLHPQARRRVSTTLRGALSADGALIVGPSDPLAPTSVPPPRATPLSVPPVRVPQSLAPNVTPLRGLESPLAPAPDKLDVLALHSVALVELERGDSERALELLERLLRFDRSYLPGLIERALLLGRSGREAEAVTEMVDLLRRTEHMPQESVVRGPRPLPVSFYRATAQSFLRGRGRAGA